MYLRDKILTGHWIIFDQIHKAQIRYHNKISCKYKSVYLQIHMTTVDLSERGWTYH